MKEKTLVLVNPEVFGEPLYLEFKDDVPISNKDEIVCIITLEQAYQMLEHTYTPYFEENIFIPIEIQKYLKDLKEYNEEENMIWEQIRRTEEAIAQIRKERKGN